MVSVEVGFCPALVISQHLEVSLRVKPFRPKTSCKARDWILEQVALGDIDVW